MPVSVAWEPSIVARLLLMSRYIQIGLQGCLRSIIMTLICQKKVCEKEKEAIKETARNPTVSPRTMMIHISVNLTVQNVNAVS